MEWLLKYLAGEEAERIPSDASLSFSFLATPEGWGWIVFFAAIAVVGGFVFLIYRRELDVCPKGMRTFLAVLRFSALLLLAGVLLNPSLTFERSQTIEPYVVLLRDASQSMGTIDAFPDPEGAKATALALGGDGSERRETKLTRAAIVNELLERKDRGWLNDLAAHGKLRIVDFSDQTNLLPETADAIPPLVPSGQGSNLAAAIEAALAHSPAAAIVMLSDGQHTASTDPLPFAKKSRESSTPVFAVGVGDPSRARNLRVASVYVRPQVWPNEPFEIKGMLATSGLGKQSLRVELLEHRIPRGAETPDEGKVVMQKQIDTPATDGQFAVDFVRTLGKSGRFAFSIRVEQLEREQQTDDNLRISSPVVVLDKQRVRVLLVSGSPSWEYRILQPLLERDRTLALSCWLQSLDEQRAQSGSEPITHLPVSEAEMFRYDVVLMLDPHPAELDPRFLELLHQFVTKHAGGLLYAAGPKYSAYLLTDARTRALTNLLPISFGDIGAIEVASLLSMNTRDWPLRVLRSNADHPLMLFYQDWEKSLSRWENLPGIYWSFPALKAKPSAKVLLEHSDPTLRRVEGARPLLVSGRNGSGHVVYLGFNGTWRWRSSGVEGEFFDRFWIQTVRHLAEGRSLKGQRRGSLQSDRDRYEVGDKVTLAAELLDSAFQPITKSEVAGTMKLADGPPLPIVFQAVANQPGRYSATFAARKSGMVSVQLPLAAAAGETSSGDVNDSQLESTFRIELPCIEMNHTWLNKPLLQEIAATSGGRYFELNELDQIPSIVPDRRARVVTPGKPISLWDNWIVLTTLVGLLSLEWTLRKWHKLL